MAKTKKFSFVAAPGLTVYAVLIQRDTGHYLNDADGGFATAPADKYQEVTEDAALAGRYTYDESRTAWADGPYEFIAYSQLGGTPDPTTDTAIASGSFSLINDSVPVTASSTILGLCTLADVKTQLNLPGSDMDQLVTDMIAAAEAMIQGKTGYTLIATDHTEYFSPGQRGGNAGTDLATLRVREHPVISVASIYEDDERSWSDPSDEIPAADYYTSGYAVRLYNDGDTRSFRAGHRTVRVIYRAGYETIPADLRRACVMMAAHLYYKAERQRQNIASESMGDAAVTYLDQAMPKEVVELLRPYTRPTGL